LGLFVPNQPVIPGQREANCTTTKYRYCEWDREHPKTNSEVEIFDAIKKWMMNEDAKARELQAEFDAAKEAQTENE
jgi:hypothetical protein